MSRVLNETFVVSKGDLPLFGPVGTPIWTTVANKATLVVQPGQLVIFDPITNQALDATATKQANPRVVVGVGIDVNGDGVSEQIRAFEVSGQGLHAHSAQAPTCGVPGVQDLLFSCVEEGDTLSVRLSVFDGQTRSFFDYNRTSDYVYTVHINESDCADCSKSEKAQLAACRLVDAIYNQGKGFEVYKNGIRFEGNPAPVEAAVLRPNSFKFCFNADPGTCTTGCTTLDLIAGMEFEGTEYAFVNNIAPGAPTKTLIAQIPLIIEQINAILGDKGQAILVHGTGSCCPFGIDINVCDEDFKLLSVLTDEEEEIVAVEIDPCASYNPLAPVNVSVECPSCEESSNGTKTFAAGVRFITRAIDMEKGCYLPDPGTDILVRQLEIFPVSGFERKDWYVQNIQSAVNARNAGYTMIHREYKQQSGGRGRDFSPINYKTGRYGLPTKNSRLNNATLLDQEAYYCVYNVASETNYKQQDIIGALGGARQNGLVAIPDSDTTTIASFEAVWNAWAGTGFNALPSVSCISANNIPAGQVK
jgi:hypothetical protein